MSKFGFLKSPRLAEIYCSIHDHSWRKSWIWLCETSHSKRNSLLTSSWFEKCFRFDIVNCLDRQKFTVHFSAMIVENLRICHLKLHVLKRIQLSLIHHGWRKFWNLASCNPPDWQNFTSLYTAIDWENFDFLYGTVRNFSYPPKTAGKFFVPPQNDHWNFHTPPLSPPPHNPAIKMTTPLSRGGGHLG